MCIKLPLQEELYWNNLYLHAFLVCAWVFIFLLTLGQWSNVTLFSKSDMQVAVVQLRWAFILKGSSGWDRNMLRWKAPCKGYMRRHLQTFRLNGHQRPWVVSQPNRSLQSLHVCVQLLGQSLWFESIFIILSQAWLFSLWNLSPAVLTCTDMKGQIGLQRTPGLLN